jgi:hypothetical protein
MTGAVEEQERRRAGEEIGDLDDDQRQHRRFTFIDVGHHPERRRLRAAASQYRPAWYQSAGLGAGVQYHDADPPAAATSKRPTRSTSPSSAACGATVAEMMYEALRYFNGETGPTGAFNYTSSGSSIGSRRTKTAPGRIMAAQARRLREAVHDVVSDINSSSDQLPGSYFGP